MSIAYNIYKNDGRGGEVDYSTPIATTTGLTFVCGPLATPGDTTFVVRAIDVASGLEEANTDARVRIMLDADGNDVTSRPGRVQGLSARPIRDGSCRVAWSYLPAVGTAMPVGFAVSLTPGSIPDLSNVAASIPYVAGVPGYECTLSGVAGNVSYTVAVVAIGPTPPLVGDPEVVPFLLAVARLNEVEALTGSSSA